MKILLLGVFSILVLKSNGFSQIASQKTNAVDHIHLKVKTIQKYVDYINAIKLLKIDGNNIEISKSGNIIYKEYCIDQRNKDVVKRINKKLNTRHPDIWVNYYKNNQIVCSKTVTGKRNGYFVIQEKYYENNKTITIIIKETHHIAL